MKHATAVRRTVALAAAAVCLPALGACSTGSTTADDSTPTATTTAEADAFPVTVETALGEATIESEPERVVTMGYADADVALALGVVPVAAEKITWGGTKDGSTVWFDEALAEIDGAEPPQRLDATDAIPVDEIIALEPDLVLATNSGLTQKDYDKLTSAGIPTVAYPGEMWLTSWQDSLDLAGRALGRSDLADQIAEDTEQLFEDTVEEYPQLDGSTVAYTYLSAADTSEIGLYGSADNRPRLLAELGIETPPIVDEVVAPGAFYATVSAERAADVEADALVTDLTAEADIATIESDPLLSQIPAIAENRWYGNLDQTSALPMSAPSPLSLPYAMEHFVPKLVAALDGNGS